MLRLLLTVTSILSTSAVALASIWEDPDWAVTSALAASSGYDSDLTESHDGPADYFVQANPSLTLLRKNSSSDIEFTAGFTATDFIDNREPAHIDYSLTGQYYFPKAENVLPVFDVNASWAKITEANTWLGLYVEHLRGSVSADGYLPIAGKLGIRATADYTLDDYPLERLDYYDNGRLFVGLAFDRDSGTEISLNIGGALGSSTPNDEAVYGGTVYSKQLFVTTRIQGQITPKISGSAYIGYSDDIYTGAYDNRYNLPIGGADLTWGVTTRSTFVLAAYSGADFTPNGQSVRTTRSFLSFTHVIVEQWQITVRAGPSYSDLSRTVHQSSDNFWVLGSEVAYQPSTRFRVALGFEYDHQTSDVSINQFQREAVTLSASYKL
jgi:hypothetical protein